MKNALLGVIAVSMVFSVSANTVLVMGGVTLTDEPCQSVGARHFRTHWDTELVGLPAALYRGGACWRLTPDGKSYEIVSESKTAPSKDSTNDVVDLHSISELQSGKFNLNNPVGKKLREQTLGSPTR